jgi:hypothetical protein
MAVLACALPCRVAAQDDKKPPPNPDVVTVDLRARTLGGTLPFDQEFRLRGPLDTLTEVVTVRYGELAEASNGTESIAGTPYCGIWIRQKPLVPGPGPAAGLPRARETQFVLRIPALRLAQDTDYRFEFALYEVGDQQLRPPPSDTQCMTDAQLQAHLGVAPMKTDEFAINGDTDTEFTQRFDTDVGIVGAPQAGYLGASSGVHFYFWQPINKKLDLAEPKWYKSFGRRVSLYGGLALNELGGGDDVKPAWGVGSPMLGFGFRGPLYWSERTPFAWALRPMRINAGVIWFKQDDPNPLVDNTSFKLTWFWSATADVDLTAILGPFAALLAP